MVLLPCKTLISLGKKENITYASFLTLKKKSFLMNYINLFPNALGTSLTILLIPSFIDDLNKIIDTCSFYICVKVIFSLVKIIP